jgi:hypothetical protein
VDVESLKADARFSENGMFVKMRGSQRISGVHINIAYRSTNRAAQSLTVFSTNKVSVANFPLRSF